MSKCPFCNIINRNAPANIVSESEKVIAILDIDPIHEGHVLILPKMHKASIHEIPADVLVEMTVTAQKMTAALEKLYHPDGCTMMQNGGEFCDFGHCHLHVFPRYHGDGFGWIDPPGEFACTDAIAENIRKTISEV